MFAKDTMGNPVADEPEFAVIQTEVVRDVAAQHGWTPAEVAAVNQALVVAAVGLQFELTPTADQFPRHALAEYDTDAQEAYFRFVQSRFRPEDVVKIRSTPDETPSYP